MCHPKNDTLIVRLVREGRLRVDGSGRGRVFLSNLHPGHNWEWREVGHESGAQQAGRRPSAGLCRRFVVKVDGRVRTLRVNRVIYVAHYGPTHLEVDHVNDDTLDCGIANLHGKTRLENQLKAREAKWMRDRGIPPPHGLRRRERQRKRLHPVLTESKPLLLPQERLRPRRFFNHHDQG